MTAPSKAKWTTVGEPGGYSPVTHDDGAAAGGAVYTQIRRRGRSWQRRLVAVNGRHAAHGMPVGLDDDEGAELWLLVLAERARAERARRILAR